MQPLSILADIPVGMPGLWKQVPASALAGLLVVCAVLLSLALTALLLLGLQPVKDLAFARYRRHLQQRL